MTGPPRPSVSSGGVGGQGEPEQSEFGYRNPSKSTNPAADYHYWRLIARGDDPETDIHLIEARKRDGWTPPMPIWRVQ